MNTYPHDMAEAERHPAAHMTFTIPGPLKKRVQARRDVNWSAIVAQAMEDRLNKLELADRLAAKSRLSERDVDELADIVDKTMAKRLGITK